MPNDVQTIQPISNLNPLSRARSLLTDGDIAVVIAKLKERVDAYGDVQAAKLLFEFKFGKNPEPPHEGTTLEELMLEGPMSTGRLSDT